jgi:hypothetical protein
MATEKRKEAKKSAKNYVKKPCPRNAPIIQLPILFSQILFSVDKASRIKVVLTFDKKLIEYMPMKSVTLIIRQREFSKFLPKGFS